MVIGGAGCAASLASLDVDRDHAWAFVCPAAAEGLLAVH
jgi:hypothetical protein